VTREPAGHRNSRLARVTLVALMLVALHAPGAHAKPRCLGKVATITGTSGNDSLEGTPKPDVIVARGGDDTLIGHAGNDLLCGGPGRDAMFGTDGRDRLSGGTGDDQLSGGLGDDRIDGGPLDFDYVNYYLSATGVQVDLSTGTSSGEGNDRLKGVENVFGSPFNDRILGNDVSNFIQPFGGDDFVDGAGELDIVFDGVGPLASGSDGDDTFDGGAGLDAAAYVDAPGPVNANLASGKATGNGTDDLDGMEGLWGSAYDDVLTGDSARNLFVPGGGNDQVDGGGANDAAAFWFAQGPVSADLSSGTASGEGNDTLTGIEGLLGSVFFGDVLRGNDQTNLLGGDAGDDQLFGEGGDDWLTGGEGNDKIEGGAGAGDIADFSTTAFLDASAPVTASLEAGTATGQGSDTIATVEQIYGSELDDTLTGDAGPNVLFGLDGDDRLFGRDGADSIDAGPGVDSADGGGGTDQCVAAEAQPSCEGGAAPAQHPALIDAKTLEDFRRNFRRNF
jgi:Ca2+-binding RTX toxin-like protein